MDEDPPVNPEVVQPDHRPPAAADPLVTFKVQLDLGSSWYLAALRAASLWRLPSEVFQRRRIHYLIGGEALDLIRVIERLAAAAPDRVDRGQLQRLQFSGQPPLALADAEFAAALGPVRYKAYLNYFYGITVEQALLHLAELEAAKAGRLDEQSGQDPHRRVYGATLAELLRAFGASQSRSIGDRLSWLDSSAFTYWLFRHRVRTQVPARMASDTQRAMAHLRHLRGVGPDDSADPLRADAGDRLEATTAGPLDAVIDLVG